MKESLGQIRTQDGKSLSFRKWRGAADVIIFLHGVESNSGWFSPFASRLNEKGFTLYGLDRRGSGLNRENRGDIDDYNIFLDDIKEAQKVYVGNSVRGLLEAKVELADLKNESKIKVYI